MNSGKFIVFTDQPSVGYGSENNTGISELNMA
jgi:hypothetical protein